MSEIAYGDRVIETAEELDRVMAAIVAGLSSHGEVLRGKRGGTHALQG
jgi:hypothetical protein